MWNYDEQATTEGPQHVGPAPSQFTCERKSLAGKHVMPSNHFYHLLLTIWQPLTLVASHDLFN